jgi:hypothetical protein
MCVTLDYVTPPVHQKGHVDGGGAVVGYDLTDSDQWTVWFVVPEVRGATVAVTVRADGEVIGFEVHAGDERVAPLHESDETVTMGESAGPFADFPRVVEPLVPKRPVPLTARMLRKIPFGALAAQARSWFGVVLFWSPDAFAEFDEHVRSQTGYAAWDSAAFAKMHSAAVAEKAARPGRPKGSDRHYAEIAVAYESWLGSGQPLRTLAEKLDTPLNTLRTALTEARARRLLTHAPRKPDGSPGGVPGGRATEKAWQLLAEGNDDGVD